MKASYFLTALVAFGVFVALGVQYLEKLKSVKYINTLVLVLIALFSTVTVVRTVVAILEWHVTR